MKAFTDSQGRSWNVVVNVSAVKRVRDLARVDLLDVANGDLLSRLADDPCLLVDVLYVLCKPDADTKGITDEDFGRSMVGGVLDAASSALIGELLDFFPIALRIGAMAKVVRKMGEQWALAVDPGVTKTPGDSSGNSPAPPESTPTS